jgi:LPPG:FO 2-phospho-L-lactate transferase
MRHLGEPDWFMLGDRDVATHVMRTAALRAGMTLTAITAELCRSFGVDCRILPMCDGQRRTEIETVDGDVLPFQDWLVKAKAAPLVRRVNYAGDDATTSAVAAAVDGCDVVVIGPSNPYVSILTLLSLQGLGNRIAAKPTIAVSPIVNGQAVKGPLAAMLRSIDALEPSAAAALGLYAGLRAVVVQHGDGAGIEAERILETDTVMKTTADRERLAAEVIELARNLL